MDYYKVTIVIVALGLFVLLFSKAAGSLAPTRMNIMSFSFYLILLTTFIGGSAAFLGFNKHYILAMMKGSTAERGYFIIVYSIICMGLCMVLFNRLMGIKDYSSYYENYINRKPEITWSNDRQSFVIMYFATLICTLAVAYTFYHVGFVGLLEMVKGNASIMEKGVSVNRRFSGNVYIRNIFALGLTPILSYCAFIFYKYTARTKWLIMFLWLFFLSVLIKTYDLSKAPVVIYLFFFYLIKVMLGDVDNLRGIAKYGCLAIAILLAIYRFVLGYRGALISLTNGPMSRIMVTQVAGVFMHIQIFPITRPFLNGASFSRSIARVLGLSEYGVRSGRVVMSVLFPSNVATDSSGVMNTFFAGEAYANFGYAGVLIAPIIVAICIGVIPTLILRQEKTPFTMTLYILLTSCYIQALIGGFVDFIYNALIIALFSLIVLIQIFTKKGNLKIIIRE